MKKITLFLSLLIGSVVCMSQDTSLRVTLYPAFGGSGGAISGSLIIFGNTAGFDNAVDINDADDPYGSNALCGIKRSGAMLSIEKRIPLDGSTQTLLATDLHTFQTPNLGNIPNRSFVIICTNLNTVVVGKIEDSYPGGIGTVALNINPAGNGTIVIDYNIITTDPPGTASKDPNRFKVTICTNGSYLRPFVFTQQLQSSPHPGGTKIDWKGENEELVTDYEIQISKDKRKFVKHSSTDRYGKHSVIIPSYEGSQRVRIKATLTNGKTVYSDMVTIERQHPTPVQGFTVFPNPILGRLAHLHFNADVGKSEVSITNLFTGHTTPLGTINAFGDQQFMLRGIVPGAYALTIRTHEGTIFTQKIIVQ